MARDVSAFLFAALWLASACGAGNAPAPVPAPAAAHAQTTPPPKSSASASSLRTEGPRFAPFLIVTDPAVLARLEASGLALGDLLVSPGTGPIENDRLSGAPRYASLKSVIARDIERVSQSDRHAGVGVSRYPHRLFDVRWLSSGSARFELTAVVNRFDRAPFHWKSCGETRLVYRLAYRTEQGSAVVASRLPMTLGLELPVTGADCRSALGRWVPDAELAGTELATFLRRDGGPLDPALVTESLPKALLVVNVQQVRWPSTVRPDLGGHAEYLLRAFRLAGSGERYEPAPLENTPDEARLRANPGLKRELLEWLSSPEALALIDRGTAVLPERFLATRALSVTPRGLARHANRPFRALFSAKELDGISYEKLALVRSAEGLLRRLDQMSCQGCHEARSIAGFHLLGDELASTPAENALFVSRSPHLSGELERRARLAERVLAEGTGEYTLPFAERARSDSGYGAHCGLGSDPTFSGWTCAPELVCRDVDAPPGEGVGQCLPSAAGAAGDPCETGPLAPHADPKRDRVARRELSDCAGSAVCNRNAVGFPAGMCTESCSGLSRGAVCGNIAVLEPFNACVARGESFLDCLANNVRPAGFRACDERNPCRDDYVCARGLRGGACIPPYFLFQLRVDGHP